MKKKLKTKKIPDVRVCSKGLYANGENINDNAKVVLKEYKALASNRKSQQLKKTDNETLYIAMTEGMKDKIKAKKVITIKSLVGNDVIDPFGQSIEVYRQTAKEILKAVEKLIQNIIMWREK